MSSASNTNSLVKRWAVCVLLSLLATNGDAVLAQPASTVAAYPCLNGAVQSTTELLRNEFGVVPGVRIAADERTSQVIVYAPPEVQSRIRQRLAVLSAAAGAAQPVVPNAAASERRQTGAISLKHCTAEQLEIALADIMGNRLAAIPSTRPAARQYRVSLRGGDSAELTIDSASKQVTIDGSAGAVDTCGRVIRALDSLDEVGGRNTRLLPLQTNRPASVRRAVAVIRNATSAHEPHMPMVTTLFPTQTQGNAPPAAERAAAPAAGSGEKAPGARPRVGLVNPVEIEPIEGADMLVLRGKGQDVDQLIELIKEIERISAETEPVVEVMVLRHADCQAMEGMLPALYEQVYARRQGDVYIVAVVKPNALLIAGRPENVETARELAKKLDQPVAPESQFRVFQLRHTAAGNAQTTITDFYRERGGLGTQMRVTVDARSNSLLVHAAPRDMEELAALIARIDTTSSQSVNELRVIQLQHSLAKDLADILQSAIGSATGGTSAGQATGSSAQGMPSRTQTPQTGQSEQQRSAMLRFLADDAQGRRLVESGILSNVRITTDARSNAIVVSAPAECMELIETLIRHLDTLQAAEAEIKVFTIANSDASSLSAMLETLFSGRTSASGQGANRAASVTAGTEGSLVALRFAVDARTNSIIASGSAAELTVVEAILNRLDDSGVRQRKNFVFRLKNSYARDVATAVDQFLTRQRQMQREQTPGITTAFEEIEREVVVVPEVGSNSLILSATPRFFEEVKALIEQLDIRPPMVMIQVLIARVDLDNTDEFGIEVGLQDGLLFDRSLLSNIQTISTTTTNLNQTTTQTQKIVAANNTPGFNFNSTDPLGNSGAANATANATQVAGQGLSSFGVNRIGKAGFGGLVLSASSESVSVLLRALNQCHRLEVLQRPQIMTLDNQSAYIQVGQQVPVIQNMQTNDSGGQNFSTSMIDVGVVLGVTPRISPDGLVVMEIDANRSEVGPEEQGTPIAVSEGQIIRSPRIERTYAQTTVSAMSGQTVVLGGLIAKSKEELHRKVPWLGDIPLLGRLFRYDSLNVTRTELMIIMTPHIVRNESEADAIKQAEAARMSWCLADVTKVHGDAGLRGRSDNWSDAETQVVYPDMKPGTGPDGKPLSPELIPVPDGPPPKSAKQ